MKELFVDTNFEPMGQRNLRLLNHIPPVSLNIMRKPINRKEAADGGIRLGRNGLS